MFPYAKVKKYIKIAKKQKNNNSFSLSQTICKKVMFGVFSFYRRFWYPLVLDIILPL